MFRLKTQLLRIVGPYVKAWFFVFQFVNSHTQQHDYTREPHRLLHAMIACCKIYSVLESFFLFSFNFFFCVALRTEVYVEAMNPSSTMSHKS